MAFIYRSPKTEVRKSPIQGVGLFAKSLIQKGEIISIKTGHIVQGKELHEIEKITGDFWFQIRDDFYLTPLTLDEAKETSVFINHSCDPSRKTVTGNDWKNKDLQEKYGMHFAWYILRKIKGWN